MTAVHINSKADTVFLGDAYEGDIFTDLSQFQESLDDQGDYLTSTSDRFAITSPRELMCRVQLATGDSGVLLYYGNDAGTDFTYALTMSSGTIRAIHNSGTQVASVTPPNLAAGEREYVITWSTCPDEVSGQHLSELSICDVTSGTWDISRGTHTTPTVNLSHRFGVAATPNGGTPFSGTIADFLVVRVGRRFHSTHEAKEDWISLSSAPGYPSGYQAPLHAPHLEDPYSANNSEDVGEALANDYAFAGPSYWLSSAVGRLNGRRLLSPIINQVAADPVILWRDGDNSPGSRFFAIGDWVVSIHHLWIRPLPFGRTRLRIRIFARTYLAAGAPGGSSVDIDIALLSSDRLPQNPGFTFLGAESVVTSTTNHGGGAGSWFEFDTTSHSEPIFMLAHRVNAAVGAAYNALRVYAVTVLPIF